MISSSAWSVRCIQASSKNEESPATSSCVSDLFDLARKKEVKAFLHSSRHSSSDRCSQIWKYLNKETGRRLFIFKPQVKRDFEEQEASSKDAIVLFPVFQRSYSTALEFVLRNFDATIASPVLSPPKGQLLLPLVGFVFILGIAVGQWLERLWFGRRASRQRSGGGLNSDMTKPPTAISVFMEGDMKKKESVEWVNMVLGKLWKIYRLGLENWVVGLLQPLIDNLKKPDYVKRVEIKRFDLGDEPISIRSVERRTSRRANDLQYHIGLRYTGGARMLLLLKMKTGLIPMTIPVGVQDLDVDGELWVKLRLVPSEPWVGTVTWAFVSLPKIKFDLSPFRFFNLMAIPFLSQFLTQLLTQDLPQLFVRPRKNVIDFLRGRAVGSAPRDFVNATVNEDTKFSGELSVTLLDARKLKYAPYGKTDPYVILTLGDQVIRSKKNSQTSVIGPPGGPIWNQDFQLLVVDRKTQRLDVRVRDYFGLTPVTVGAGEVDLMYLKDTVPVDKVVRLRGVWGPLRRQYVGEVLLRLTYTAYVEEDEYDDSMIEDYSMTEDEYDDDDAPVLDDNSMTEDEYDDDASVLDEKSMTEYEYEASGSVQSENSAALIKHYESFTNVINDSLQSSEVGNHKLTTQRTVFHSEHTSNKGSDSSNGGAFKSETENTEQKSRRSILTWFLGR